MSTPQFDPEKILECARSIRPALPELLGSEAEAFDRQLGDLLAQADAGGSVHAEILELLKSNPKTYQLAAESLAPKQISKGEYQRLPGQSVVQKPVKYICPVCNNFTRYLRLGEEIPLCSTDQVALVPAD